MPDLTDLFVYPFLLVFIRLAGAMMIFPALSDPSINPRARLLAALGTAFVMFPLLAPGLPELPTSTATFILYLGSEFFIGVLLGLGARLFMAATNVAGEIVAFTSGFQSATLFDPATGANTTAPTLYFAICAGMLVLATNTHHLMIEGVAESYLVFPVGQFPPMDDVVQAIIKVVADTFVVGIKMAAPVMVIGFLGYVAFGIFNRLIPQLHVFFVALPISIAVGILVLSVTLGAALTLFVAELQNHAILFALPEEGL